MTVYEIVREQLRKDKTALAVRLARNSLRMAPRPGGHEVGCLLWKGAVNSDEYPKMNFRCRGKHRQVYVHHVTYFLYNGIELPEGTERDHICNYENCIEPRHLQHVTHADNCKLRQQRLLQRLGYSIEDL